MSWKVRFFVSLFLLMGLISSFTLVALAAGFTVNTQLDGGDANPGDGNCDDGNGRCTLRAAIQEANNNPTYDTINIPAGTYVLTDTTDTDLATDLDITTTMTLQKSGAGTVIIDGNTTDRVFDISASGVATITGVTIRNGSTSTTIGNSEGGGIRNQGTLVLSGTIVTGNTAADDGGGIFNEGGDLTLVDTTVSSNQALGTNTNTGVGGGIANSAEGSSNATLTVTGSRITTNTVRGVGGGGISNGADADQKATATISATVISGNTASSDTVDSNNGFGGGIRNSFFGTADSDSEAILYVYNSTLENNSAYNGGGIASGTNTEFKTLTVHVENSTISGNTATDGNTTADGVGNGGGLLNQNGTTTVVNSTISGNTAEDQDGNGSVTGWGGGIVNTGFDSDYLPGVRLISPAVWLTNTTVTGNTAISGTAVANAGGNVTATLANFNNTILAGTCYNATHPAAGTYAITGTLTSLNYNLENGNTCNLTATHDIINTDPRLDLLQDNGGQTETHALGAESPAIDTGDCVTATDQRGVDRPDGVTPFCDIGAYEAGTPGYVDLEINKTVSPTDVDPGDTITYTITFTNTGWAPASGVVITDIVPPDLINLTPTNSGATITNTTGYTYSWTVADLYHNEGGVITITAEVDSGASGSVKNTAAITTTYLNPDNNISNNTNDATLSVGGIGPVYLPIIMKSAS